MVTHSTCSTAKAFIVDDDPSVLNSLARLVRGAGIQVESFSSSQEFLKCEDRASPACLLLDVAMPGLSGLQVQQSLTNSGNPIPVIFISGHADTPTAVTAMKAGAVDFLSKPVRAKTLLEAIERALAKDEEAQRERKQLAEFQSRFEQLTPREVEVLKHVLAGNLNKQIALALGTVEQTIKIHRGRVMFKMGVDSVASLVRMAGTLGIEAAPAFAS